jgi:hypothetical protein
MPGYVVPDDRRYPRVSWNCAVNVSRGQRAATVPEVSLEFPLHVVWQRPALPGQEFDEHRGVLRDDAVEQRMLRPVAPCGPSHAPRP